MSFMKYIESKVKPSIHVDMNEYKERLYADMASLILKPNTQLVEAKKNLTNIREIAKTLSELAYPLSDEFCMAIRTAEPKKVNNAHKMFRQWADYYKPDRNLSDKIETAIFHYQTKLYKNEFGSAEADSVAKSSLVESISVIDQMVHNINLAISKIPSWQNHKIVIEAIYPETGWVINEAKISVGDAFKAVFLYEHTSTGFKAKLTTEEDLPASLKDDMQNLLVKLKNNPKYNKILTLYMTRPISERRYFEIAKRDLSLGIEAVLPNHITLTTTPITGDSDVWKVKVEEKYVKEFLHEGNVKEYQAINEEIPIKWIERIGI